MSHILWKNRQNTDFLNFLKIFDRFIKMLNEKDSSVAITALAVCIFNSKFSNVDGLKTSISKAERFLADRKIDFESFTEKLKL